MPTETPAPRRRRRVVGGRPARSILLAAAALVAVLYGLQRNLALDAAELWRYGGLSLLLLLPPLIAALALFVLRLWFRTLSGRRKSGSRE